MQVLTYDQSAEWCRLHGFQTRQIQGFIAGPDPDLAEPEFHFAAFSIPKDAGRRVCLAKLLLSLIDPSVELLAHIGDWAVWPSGQHMPLFDRFRQAFGERRPLIEAPAHVLQPAERDDAASVVIICVLLLWNCHVLSGRGDEAFFVSHDEDGWFTTRETTRLDEIRMQLREAGVLMEPQPAK